jgi:hypothetical protein
MNQITIIHKYMVKMMIKIGRIVVLIKVMTTIEALMHYLFFNKIHLIK